MNAKKRTIAKVRSAEDVFLAALRHRNFLLACKQAELEKCVPVGAQRKLKDEEEKEDDKALGTGQLVGDAVATSEHLAKGKDEDEGVEVPIVKSVKLLLELEEEGDREEGEATRTLVDRDVMAKEEKGNLDNNTAVLGTISERSQVAERMKSSKDRFADTSLARVCQTKPNMEQPGSGDW